MVKFLPLASDRVMGRSKAIDDADLQEVLTLRDDFGAMQQDNIQMRSQVSKLQGEFQVIGAKQGQISATVGTVEEVVLAPSKQLLAISNVLQTLVKSSHPEHQQDNPSSSAPVVRSPTLRQEYIQEQEERIEKLRKQLAAKKEKSKQLEDIQLQNLPPTRTNRVTVPPGFVQQRRNDTASAVGTPVTGRHNAHTPAFN